MRNFLLYGGLAALVLAWNLPNHYPLWTTFHGELTAAAGVCLLFLATLWRPMPAATAPPTNAGGQQLFALPLPTSARVWFLVALLPLAQYFTGALVFRGDALMGFMYALGVVMALYTGYLWASQEGSARVLESIFLAIVWAGLAAGGVALAQWLQLPAPSWWTLDLGASVRPYGNLAQPNHFGLLMVMGIVAATALFEARVLSHRLSYGVVLFFFGWCMLISTSRASALALLSIVAFWFITYRRVASRLRVPAVLLALVVGLVAYKSLGHIEDSLYLQEVAARAPLEIGPRELIWRHFWAAILEHPWLGYGFGQGILAIREVATQVQPSRNSVFAHNFVLDLMTWVGVPLGLAISLALGAWMLRWLRKAGSAALSAQRHWVFALWLALVIQSLLEFPYAHTYFLLPAALLAGAVIALPSSHSAFARATRYTASWPAVALAGVAMALLTALTSDYMQLEDDFRSLRFGKAGYVYAVKHHDLVDPWILDQLVALTAAGQLKLRPGMPPDQLELLGTVAQRVHLLPVQMDYAKALALNGRLMEAQAEMRIIRSLWPPATFALIERDWQDWLKENPQAIAVSAQ